MREWSSMFRFWGVGVGRAVRRGKRGVGSFDQDTPR